MNSPLNLPTANPKILRYSSLALFAATLMTAARPASTSDRSLRLDQVEITVPANSMMSVSNTARNSAEAWGIGAINLDYAPGSPGTQTLTRGGADWTPGEWAPASGAGYLAYLSDHNGAQEAFLIVANTADTLTLQTSFDLLDAARSIPANVFFSIRRAHTIGSLLGTGSSAVLSPGDQVYLWDTKRWLTYRLGLGNEWFKYGSFFPASDDIVYPEEGFFVQRNQSTPVTLTFPGHAPRRPQVSTLPGPGLYFLGVRYPQQITVGQLGLQDLPNWAEGAAGDHVYLWTGTKWLSYFYQGSHWRKQGSFGIHDDDPLPPNSAVFVVRVSTSPPAEAANVHPLPDDDDHHHYHDDDDHHHHHDDDD